MFQSLTLTFPTCSPKQLSQAKGSRESDPSGCFHDSGWDLESPNSRRKQSELIFALYYLRGCKCTRIKERKRKVASGHVTYMQTPLSVLFVSLFWTKDHVNIYIQPVNAGPLPREKGSTQGSPRLPLKNGSSFLENPFSFMPFTFSFEIFLRRKEKQAKTINVSLCSASDIPEV